MLANVLCCQYYQLAWWVKFLSGKKEKPPSLDNESPS
jgi:hypothetical protein